jgi:tripartite-type tricarboxylate transporter receptor subunit TctC
MKLPRREFLRLAMSASALPAIPRAANADVYPSRPVRLVVGLPPANSPDIVARLFAQYLSERLGQAFVVENRPGAATNIGTDVVAHAAPDGYTLLLITAGNTVNETVFRHLNFDFLSDIAPVASIGGIPFVMVVTPSLPAATVPEFIAYAKANPGKIDMASSGTGSMLDLLGALFELMAGVRFVHVPYRDSLFPDLLSGQAQVAFNPAPAVMGHIKSGRLRALGVTTAGRIPVLPDVPALGEFLPGYDANGWLGIGAPKGTPAAAIDTLSKAVNAGLADPVLATKLTDLGAVLKPMSPAAFAAFMVAETAKWAEVVKFADIKAE